MTATPQSCQTSFDSYTPMPLNFVNSQILPNDWYIPLFLRKFDFLVAHDTEYVQGGDGQIQVLSHQLFIIEPTKRTFTDRIIFIDDDKRLSLPELLAAALSAHGYGPRTAKGKTVYVVQHFGLAEISTLRDRKDWYEKLTPVRNCPVTPRPLKVKARFSGDNYADVRLTIQDTMLHAAAGMGSLRALGTICSTRKVDVGDYITCMDELLSNDRELYIEYACTDTRVTLEYELRFQTSIEKLSNLVGTPKAKPGITLGGSGVNLLESYIHAHEETGASFSTIFGLTEKSTLETYSEKHGLQKKRMYLPARMASDPIASLAYYGGTNVAYTHSRIKCGEDEIIVDLDLKSAYPTAYAVQPSIDYKSHTRTLHSIDDIVALHKDLSAGVPHVYAFVDFEFPASTLYPCIPLTGEFGLVHPLCGEGVPATGVEIALAVSMGADVRLSRGEPALSLPALLRGELLGDFEVDFTFADFFGLLIAERRKYPKKSINNLTCKEICNSIYGKTAQGIRYRLLPSTKKQLPPSKITCPAYAATCTGIVRAALLSVVDTLSRFPGVKILSATTDGCMVKLPRRPPLEITTDDRGIAVLPELGAVLPPELLEAVHATYPVRAMLTGLKKLGLADEYVLEVKHIGDVATTYKTRAYHMFYQGVCQFLAKGGLKGATPSEMGEIALQEDRVLRKFERLPSFADMQAGKYKDLIPFPCTNSASLDVECKRVFTEGGLNSRPPRDIAEVMKIRNEILKLHKQDKQASPAALQILLTMKESKCILRGSTKQKILRILLVAIVRGVNAWHRGRRSYEELAEIFCVSLATVKRCKKSPYFQVAPDNAHYRQIVRDYASKVDILQVTQQMYHCILYPV